MYLRLIYNCYVFIPNLDTYAHILSHTNFLPVLTCGSVYNSCISTSHDCILKIYYILSINSLGPIAHICAHLFQTFGAHSAYMRASSSPSSKEDASVYATAIYHRQSQDRQYYNKKLFSAAKTGQSPCL